jgi:4-hydroxy-3-polyprenylbenzoate decarboxylase
MGYRSLSECVNDLAAAGHLVRIDDQVDAHLECAAIVRRVCAATGPAILFTNIRGCAFPMAGNLFGTLDRARFVFRDSWEGMKRFVELALEPSRALAHPFRYASVGRVIASMRPKFVKSGPVLAHETSIDQLPQQVSWPRDGGAFITLPQVYTEDPTSRGWRRSNLGMYRIQLSGGQYEPNREVGLHYQIHRSIGVHHAAAQRLGQPLAVNVFVGGPPAMTLAAVMPLPEGVSELAFAGALARRRVRMIRRPQSLPIHADADFCITGTVASGKLLPEGPFGDHLGYYSLAHPFPVLRVEKVYHRPGAIWPLTVVGRPPQEDTVFGQLIHELTGPAISRVLPGVEAVHAVDAAGVHPLLLAIGSERYTPYLESRDKETRDKIQSRQLPALDSSLSTLDSAPRPQELLTQANAILGQGQLSLAKYLLIANRFDAPHLDIHDVGGFLGHVLARADWRRDLHFQTQTTIDTLDYSGGAINQGSKLVIAAVGPPRFELARELPADLRLPGGFRHPRLALAGVLLVEGPPAAATGPAASGPGTPDGAWREDMARFCGHFSSADVINRFRWVVIVDDSGFAAESLRNFLWVTFTRTNPAADVHGIEAFTHEKHWGCRGALVIDARSKPHHAPPLEEDPEVERRTDRFFTRGGPLHTWGGG